MSWGAWVFLAGELIMGTALLLIGSTVKPWSSHWATVMVLVAGGLMAQLPYYAIRELILSRREGRA